MLLCYIGAIVSAFASSVGIMGALIPLAVPFLAQGEIGAVGMVAALAVSATVVDVSPFSTNGALVLAAAPDVDRERFFRQLMAYGGIVVAAVPAVVWLVMVVPGWGRTPWTRRTSTHPGRPSGGHRRQRPKEYDACPLSSRPSPTARPRSRRRPPCASASAH